MQKEYKIILHNYKMFIYIIHIICILLYWIYTYCRYIGFILTICIQKAVSKGIHSIGFRRRSARCAADGNALHSHSCFSGQRTPDPFLEFRKERQEASVCSMSVSHSKWSGGNVWNQWAWRARESCPKQNPACG